MTRPAAAVDVGSNSVRCLVLDGHGHPVARELAITRLAAGVDATGRLDDAALERTLDALVRYRELWESHGVDTGRVRIAATSAVRDADDRDRFFDGVRRVAGVDARVLTGEEEAATAYRGASGGLDAPHPLAVLDIGGGSTEVVVGDGAGDVAGWHSLQLGSVRLTERVLRDEPPTAGQVAAARHEIEARLDELDDRLAADGAAVSDAATLVGVAGTVTTLAALVVGADRYVAGRVHGQRISGDELGEWADRLCGMIPAEVAALGPVQPGREDVLAAGALIADAVVDRYRFDELMVSEADILDGLAATAADA
jgi:exopolyphosphatase/guanosine-5'-triphosphate,3'-diphosphate pyrophosphatase